MQIGQEVKRIIPCEHVEKGKIGVVLTPIRNQIVEVLYDERKMKQFVGNLAPVNNSLRGKHGNHVSNFKNNER